VSGDLVVVVVVVVSQVVAQGSEGGRERALGRPCSVKRAHPCFL